MAGGPAEELAVVVAPLPPGGEVGAGLGTKGQAGGEQGVTQDLLAEAAEEGQAAEAAGGSLGRDGGDGDRGVRGFVPGRRWQATNLPAHGHETVEEFGQTLVRLALQAGQGAEATPPKTPALGVEFHPKSGHHPVEVGLLPARPPLLLLPAGHLLELAGGLAASPAPFAPGGRLGPEALALARALARGHQTP